jgi:hypothetical protein
MLAIILVIACILAIYFETKSIKACFVAEVYDAAIEQMFNLVLLIIIIVYIYLTQNNLIINITL